MGWIVCKRYFRLSFPLRFRTINPYAAGPPPLSVRYYRTRRDWRVRANAWRSTLLTIYRAVRPRARSRMNAPRRWTRVSVGISSSTAGRRDISDADPARSLLNAERSRPNDDRLKWKLPEFPWLDTRKSTVETASAVEIVYRCMTNVPSHCIRSSFKRPGKRRA